MQNKARCCAASRYPNAIPAAAQSALERLQMRAMALPAGAVLAARVFCNRRFSVPNVAVTLQTS